MSKVFAMRKILSASLINVKKILLAATLILIINCIAFGQVELIAAIFIGYVLAAFYVISTAARLSRVISMSRDQAKRQMLIGLVLRLLMLLIVLFVAIHISERIFFAVVIGFLTFYIFIQIGLIVHSYKMSYHNGNDVDKK